MTEDRDENVDPIREGASSRVDSAMRLRSRLRKALTRESTVIEKVKADSSSQLPTLPDAPPVTRAGVPEEEDGLLIWRERFFVDDSDARVRADLFGESFAAADGLENAERVLLGAGLSFADLAFVDIETCGLADDPIFLVGIAWRLGDEIELLQLFARDPTSEPEMLRRSVDVLAQRRTWVSFNGRSFDVPRMRRRARTHGIDFPDCEIHRDLLHEVRRRWKGELPNCKLSTVEKSLLGLGRLPGDVPGREVPERYWDFVKGGERRWIEPVIEHNRRDIAALVALLVHVLEDGLRQRKDLDVGAGVVDGRRAAADEEKEAASLTHHEVRVVARPRGL